MSLESLKASRVLRQSSVVYSTTDDDVNVMVINVGDQRIAFNVDWFLTPECTEQHKEWFRGVIENMTRDIVRYVAENVQKNIRNQITEALGL